MNKLTCIRCKNEYNAAITKCPTCRFSSYQSDKNVKHSGNSIIPNIIVGFIVLLLPISCIAITTKSPTQIQNELIESQKLVDKRNLELAEKKAAEEKCKTDPICVPNSGEAEYHCSNAIENRARFQSKWVNGWTEPRFQGITWRKGERKEILMFGNNVMFQNGFGAWKRIDYSCTYNALANFVVDVDIRGDD